MCNIEKPYSTRVEGIVKSIVLPRVNGRELKAGKNLEHSRTNET